jgi:putative ABC transport system permease protein
LRTRPYAWRGGEGETEWGSTAAHYLTVTPGWFPAVGARLLAGRWLDEHDDRDRPVAVVVDAALATRAWPGAGAVGQPIRVELFREGEFRPVWGEVVGVVETLRLDRLEFVGREQVYLAHAQSPQRTMHPAVRADGDPRALLPALRREVSALEPDLPVFDVRLAEEHVASATAVSRFALFTLLAFASVAVLLAAAGVYAVMSHHVAARRLEIGVRLALGASPGRILRLVVGRGMALAGGGVAAGLALAPALTRGLSSLLYGVAPHDVATLGACALLLAVVALLACWAPAREVSRLDATTVLREP